MQVKNQKKVGIILTYSTQVVKIIVGLLYTPVMLRIVGQNEYGIYQIADSTISYLSLINLGILGAYGRYYTMAEKGEERDKSEVNGVFLTVLLFLAMVCLFAGGLVVCNAERLLGTGITPTEYVLTKKLMIVLLVNMAISFPAGVFEHNITINEKFIAVKVLDFLKALLNPFIALPLLLLGYGSIGLVAATTILSVSAYSIEIVYCFVRLKIRFCISFKSFRMMKDIGKFTFFIFLNEIIQMLNWNIDKLLIGRSLGSAAVAVYSVGGQIRSLYSSFPSAIRTVFQPQMYRMVAGNKEAASINAFFVKVGRIQCHVILPIIIGFVCIGRQFIILWTDESYAEAYYVALLLMIPIAIPNIQDIGIDLQRARNKHQARSVVYFFIAVMNVIITIPLIKNLGICGAALGTGISILLGNGFFMNIYYWKVLDINISAFWKVILKILIPQIAFGVVFWFACRFFVLNSWIKLIATATVYLILYCVISWFACLNDFEKKTLAGLKRKLW